MTQPPRSNLPPPQPAILLCYAAMMALAISINLLPVFLITLARDFQNLSAEQLGRIGALTFTGLVSAILLTGPLVDRLPAHGPRLFAVMGNLLIVAGLCLLASAKTFSTVLGAGYLMGFGAGTLDMVLSPIVAALRPNHRTIAMNLLHAFYCAGAVVTILVGAVALHAGISWRSTAMVLTLLPALVAGGFLIVTLPPLVPEGHSRLPTATLLRHPFFLLAIVAIFLGGATEISIAYWLPTYAERDLHFSKIAADLGFLAFSLAMAVGRLLIAFLPHRLPPILLMLYCCVGSTLLFLLAGIAAFPALALAACILAGLTGSALWPSTLAITADRFPHGGATMFGLLAATGNLGGILMPWLVGLLADHTSLALALATSAACPFLMIPTLLLLRRLPTPPPAFNPLAPDVRSS